VDRAVYRGLLLFAGTVLAIWAFALILLPFIVPVAWALCIFAVTVKPYRWLAARTRRPRISALLLVLGTGCMVLGPMIYIATVFIDQAGKVNFKPTVEKLKAEAPELLASLDKALVYFERPDGPAKAAVVPEGAAGEAAEGAVAEEDAATKKAPIGSVEGFVQRTQSSLPGLASSVLGWGTVKGALGFLMTPFFFLFGLVLTLVTQFFLYRESPRLRRMFVEVSPLSEDDTGEVLDTLRGATVSAVVGGLLVAVMQGALGTLMFSVAGIPSPVMWGVVMAAFSLLPFGGTAFVWAPAGLLLLLTGSPGAGWFVLIFGTVIVAGSDNILRPVVLNRLGGENVQIHPMLLFFAILSGIGIFGISGIVFGPLLIALLTTMVRIYRRHGASNHASDDATAGDATAGDATAGDATAGEAATPA
jgi:predicted PurR-regulated permease PerM